MIWKKDNLIKLRRGIFINQIKKRQHPEILGSPHLDLLE